MCTERLRRVLKPLPFRRLVTGDAPVRDIERGHVRLLQAGGNRGRPLFAELFFNEVAEFRLIRAPVRRQRTVVGVCDEQEQHQSAARDHQPIATHKSQFLVLVCMIHGYLALGQNFTGMSGHDSHGQYRFQYGPRRNVPTTVNSRMTTQMTMNTMFCRFRSGDNQTPTEPGPDLSRYGHHTANASRAPGNRIPPINAPLIVNEPIVTVVTVTISCSHRKYQGALAGFGVTDGFAGASSGAGNAMERSTTAANVRRETRRIRRSRWGDDVTVVDSSSTTFVWT